MNNDDRPSRPDLIFLAAIVSLGFWALVAWCSFLAAV